MSVAHARTLLPARSARTRVMVADDSVVVRGLIARWLEEGGFEVVATAANGLQAIELLDRADPDIVLLDIDMPELDGLATLPRLLEKRPDLSVVVISTLTQRNARISLKCLSLGAVDYVPKPESNRQATISTSFRGELIAKLEALGRRRRTREHPDRRGEGRQGPIARAATPALAPRPTVVAPRCLLIAASTGGPKAVAAVLASIGPALRRVPVLVVQHMPPVFTAVFADHLSTQLGCVVTEGEHGEPLQPGKILIAPGGRHMGLASSDGRTTIRLDDGPPEHFCRPAVDVLFRDAASTLGASALAVVLTGMGRDGTDGAAALVTAGGAVFVQDEATSTVWGMPGSVAKAGLAHDILPLDAIAPAIRAVLPSGAR